MDYRRYYGLRAPRPIGYSTYLVPQLENYSLFATPFMDLNKKLNKLVEGFRQEVMDQSETVIKAEEKVKRKGQIRSEEKKSEEDEQKLSEETSEVDVNFGIVLNVATVKPEDLSISLGEGNEIEVNVNQSDVKLGRMEITYSRDCSYKYQLPDDVDKNSLVALRTTDHFLIILPRDVLRKDLFFKSIKAAKLETTESADLEAKESGSKKGSDSKESGSKKGSDSKESGSKKGSDSKESESKKGSKSKESERKGSDPKERKEEAKTRKGSKLDACEAIAEEVDESSKSEMVFLNENGIIPVQVSRMLRPGLDIFLLRKYMVDLESYVSTVRKFVENASFITRNSKTAEIRIRASATTFTDEHLEKFNVVETVREKAKKVKKILKEPFGESGYTSSDKSSEGLPLDASDESSRSSSRKSVESTRDKSEE